MRTHRRGGLVPTLTALTVGLVASAAAPASALTPEGLEVRAEGRSGSTVQGAGELEVVGSTALDISVPSIASGAAVLVDGPGAGVANAVRFPAYVDSGTYPRAVVRLVPRSGNDLTPRWSDFEFGAVLKLDHTSSGRSEDNGDNVFQRGLWNDSAQFKLEVDDRRPTCAVKGSAGRKVVRAKSQISSDRWYTVRCLRVGNQVSVEVSPYGSPGATERTSGWGRTGELAFSYYRDASVGGKLNSAGKVMSGATDQFNGAIGKVWINRL